MSAAEVAAGSRQPARAKAHTRRPGRPRRRTTTKPAAGRQRLKWLASERRFSISVDWIRDQGIERDDVIWVSSLGGGRLVLMTNAQRAALEDFAQTRRRMGLPRDPAIVDVAPVRLGSQDRVVIPQGIPMPAERCALSWDIGPDGLYYVWPTDRSVPVAALAPAPSAGLLEAARADLAEILPIDRIVSQPCSPAMIEVARSTRTRTLAEQRPVVVVEIAPKGPTGQPSYRALERARWVRAWQIAGVKRLRCYVVRGLPGPDVAKLLTMEQSTPEERNIPRIEAVYRLHKGGSTIREIADTLSANGPDGRPSKPLSPRSVQRYLRVGSHDALREAIAHGAISIQAAEAALRAGAPPEWVAEHKPPITIAQRLSADVRRWGLPAALRLAARKPGEDQPRGLEEAGVGL